MERVLVDELPVELARQQRDLVTLSPKSMIWLLVTASLLTH